MEREADGVTPIVAVYWAVHRAWERKKLRTRIYAAVPLSSWEQLAEEKQRLGKCGTIQAGISIVLFTHMLSAVDAQGFRWSSERGETTGSAWATSRFTVPSTKRASWSHTHLAGALLGFAAQAFVDGSLGSHTAYMFEPFADTPDQGTKT